MSEVILLAGGIGSGKAHVMNKMLMERKETGNNIFCISFADPIKKIVKEVFGYDKNGIFDKSHNDEIFGFDVEEHYNQIIKRVARFTFPDIEDCIPIEYQDKLKTSIQYFLHTDKYDVDNLKILIRSLMQLIGTEIGQSILKNIWPAVSNDVIECINETTDIDYVFIDDWRFMFEYFSVYCRFQHEHKVIPYYITASPETRAKRRNITVEELEKQSQHYSERESNEVILNWMGIYYPNNIIVNEG